jgi:hypothetical protein
MAELNYYTIATIIFLSSFVTTAQNYPDQNYVLRIDSIYNNIESSYGITLSPDGKSITLQSGINDGYFILKPQFSSSPFNQGLPSWNGTAAGSGGSFKIQMRFPYGSGWSHG